MSTGASVLFGLLLLVFQATAQEDSLMQQIKLDSIATETSADSASKATDTNSNAKNDGGNSVAKKAGTDSTHKKAVVEEGELINIVPGNKKIRPYGWGEYRVNGRCLCCDNVNDGDCIYVQTIERTERERIPQIIDGKTDGDKSDKTTYFGDLNKRDLPKTVELLMAEISLGKMYEIGKVVVYTISDKEKRLNYLTNCDLGYYDQFGRLLWAGKAERTTYDAPITFNLKNPVFTKMLLLRVDGGKNRITEVAIFSKKQKQ